MQNVFEKIYNDESILKIRVLSICAFVSSFVFYYLMVLLAPAHLDWLPGRLIVAAISVFSFLVGIKKSNPFYLRRIMINLISFSYILLYFYLLYINGWSVFHRWSYFVVIAIMATLPTTWRDYLYTAALALFVPLALGHFSPLTPAELLHFHAANFVTFFVIGITIKSNFEYRDEVIQLTNNLVQNSKMTALGEMSSGLSHEINNPLAIIMNSTAQLELFIEDIEKNKSSIPSALEKINRGVLRIAKIVKGLHDFSQSDNKEFFSKVDIRKTVEAAIQFFDSKFKNQGIEFIYKPPAHAIYCFCQPQQICQAISNLLSNALEASQNITNPTIEIQITTTENAILILVLDNGVGISPEIESQILLPFFTTKPIGKATGLGLSIALGIARFNDGDLTLSQKGSPTCFTLRLPLAQNQQDKA